MGERDNPRMSNPVFEAVRTVMAIREYQDKPVPDEVVDRIIDAARLTASGSNRQPWHFVVIREREHLQELGALVRTGPYTARASLAVVAAYLKESHVAVSDVSRAIQSMILTAWADGVGSNWTGFGSLEGVRKAVGLPDDYEVLAVVPFGYPARPVKGIKKRKPRSEVASAERFGSPFS